ncbi:MAG: c-type cytochrome domain-containing protein [Verrucomicrobiota bacterium]
MKAIQLIVVIVSVSAKGYSLDYEDDIMPIFEKKCAECHSNASGKARGGFKVDDPDHLLDRLSKNSLVIPGDWDASYLFVTLFRPPDHKDAMPPEGKGERLTPEETVLVQRWIAEGAEINGVRGETGPMPKQGELGYITQSSDPDPDPEGEAMPEPVERLLAAPKEWTNLEGKTILATLMGIEGDVALLKMSNGQVYRYPIAKLSDDSREALTP